MGGIAEGKIKGEGRDRALKYEERLREGKGNELARRCEKEIRKKGGEGGG